MISRIVHFIDEDIWKIHIKNLSTPKYLLVKSLRIILLAFHGFSRNNCYKTASVLTYYSLLNIVPLVAVAFGIAKGFGLEKLIERQIFHIAEKAHWQPELTIQILTFSHKLLKTTKGSLIAGIGVIMLFLTVVSILGKIETAFNETWEVKKTRTFVRKFSDYISLIVLVPILLIISSSATVLISSKLKIIMNKIAYLGIFSTVILFIINILPYVSIWVLLILLYLVMPNTKIPIRSAILGAFSAGTIAQIAQWIYFKFQLGVVKYGAIYGGFAALPLLLVWLQLTWMIVLFGAEIAHAYEHYETFGFHPDYSRISLSSKKFLILRIFHLIIKRFSQGEKPLNAYQIAYILEIPIRLVKQILNELVNVGLVVETVMDAKGEVAFQPGKAIEDITIKSALDEYEKYGTVEIPDFQSKETDNKILESLKEISETIDKYTSNVKIKEI